MTLLIGKIFVTAVVFFVLAAGAFFAAGTVEAPDWMLDGAAILLVVSAATAMLALVSGVLWA